jgi:hypothetical protein
MILASARIVAGLRQFDQWFSYEPRTFRGVAGEQQGPPGWLAYNTSGSTKNPPITKNSKMPVASGRCRSMNVRMFSP